MNHEYFRRVGFKGKHGFAEEALPYGNPIHAAGQFAVPVPHFDGVSYAPAVQFRVTGDHVVGYPGAFATGGGAQADDAAEGLISGDMEAALVQRSAQTAGYVDVFGEEHTARVWRPPEYGLVVAVPGKYAAAVGEDEALCGEVSAQCE